MLMFILTLNKSKLKILLIICVLCFTTACITLLCNILNHKEENKQQENNVYQFDVENNESRVNFLKSFGWEVEQAPIKVNDITIPLEFNETYQRYNDIQKGQGLDLSGYKGKICKLYTYKVLNYPQQSKNIYADMIIVEGMVIGGDVCSSELGGFMHGFSYQNTQDTSYADSCTDKYPVESSTERQTLTPDPQMPNAPTD